MVSVIIPTVTGGLNHLVRLMPLLALEQDVEVIVIDNWSRDGTSNYLAGYEVLLKINKEKRNFSQSNNQGAKYGQGDYFLFLNNDTAPDVGFTRKMVETFDCDLSIGVVGCCLITMDPPKRVQHAGVCFTTGYVPYELGLPQTDIGVGLAFNDPRVRSTREVPSVTAACMMVKKDVFFEVGGFDEEYINGWEDTDLVLKIREKGYKVWYNGEATVYHKHFGSRNAGRFNFEQQNRARYDRIWVDTNRAKSVLNGFREA